MKRKLVKRRKGYAKKVVALYATNEGCNCCGGIW